MQFCKHVNGLSDSTQHVSICRSNYWLLKHSDPLIHGSISQFTDRSHDLTIPCDLCHNTQTARCTFMYTNISWRNFRNPNSYFHSFKETHHKDVK